MKIVLYDKKPGSGFGQWFLKTCWMIGCWFQKLLGAVDEYHGVSSWDEVLEILSKKEGIDSLQYWGHGSPGRVYLAGKFVHPSQWLELKGRFASDKSLLWFRCCSVFRGLPGFEFSKIVSDGLGVIVAGHTRIIGPVQGGLHTRSPGTQPSWPVDEKDVKSILPQYLTWTSNSILFITTKIPKGW